MIMRYGFLGLAVTLSLLSAGCSASDDTHDMGTDNLETLPAPGCDEDNPAPLVSTTLDQPMPNPIVQFERQQGWNCMHRQWHDTRKLRILLGSAAQYAREKGWTRVDPQEGGKGNGLEFLAMHRVMISTLRVRFTDTTSAELLKGWSTPPTDPNDPDNPLPNRAKTGFDTRMLKAINRIENQQSSFTGDDDFGLYVETNLRPTEEVPWNISTDRSTGIHNYLHGRFNDPISPIRMGNFARNIENRNFWKLHGWLDNMWTRYRRSKGLVDAEDATYMRAMDGACKEMGLGSWETKQAMCSDALKADRTIDGMHGGGHDGMPM